MLATSTCTVLLALAVIAGATEPGPRIDPFTEPPSKREIDWQPCGPSGFSCGSFEMPLDWHNPSAGYGRLPVMKVNATGERKGVLFAHPGALGGSSRDWLMTAAEAINNHLTNGSYDIVTWEMRGSPNYARPSNHTVFPPSPRCFLNHTEESAFWRKRETVPDMPPQNMSTFEYRSNYGFIGNRYQKTKKHNEKCLSTQQESYPHLPYFEYMGTAATVRDLVALADTIQGYGQPINFWAVTHGSLIGSYLINMFPERVGRIILDGPVDPAQHVSTPSHIVWGQDIENANTSFTTFVDICAQDSFLCKILNRGKFYNGEIIRTYVTNILAIARSIFMGSRSVYGADIMMNPTLQNWATKLHNATGGPPVDWLALNWTTTLHNTIRDIDKNPQIGALATMCGDHVDPDEDGVNDKELIQHFASMTGQNPLLAQHMIFPSPRYLCHLWPIRAVERYLGPWNRKPAHPVLLLGNTLNPLNGFDHAKRVAEQMGEHAVFIEQEGFASSIFPHHPRAVAMMRRYMLEGVLPTEEERIVTVEEDLPMSYWLKFKLRAVFVRSRRAASMIFSVGLALLMLAFALEYRYVRKRGRSSTVLPVQREEKADFK